MRIDLIEKLNWALTALVIVFVIVCVFKGARSEITDADILREAYLRNNDIFRDDTEESRRLEVIDILNRRPAVQVGRLIPMAPVASGGAGSGGSQQGGPRGPQQPGAQQPSGRPPAPGSSDERGGAQPWSPQGGSGSVVAFGAVPSTNPNARPYIVPEIMVQRYRDSVEDAIDMLYTASGGFTEENGRRAFEIYDINPDSILGESLIGLQPGDKILSVNGRAIEGVGQARRLYDEMKHESNFQLEIVRGGQTMYLNFTVARQR